MEDAGLLINPQGLAPVLLPQDSRPSCLQSVTGARVRSAVDVSARRMDAAPFLKFSPNSILLSASPREAPKEGSGDVANGLMDEVVDDVSDFRADSPTTSSND